MTHLALFARQSHVEMIKGVQDALLMVSAKTLNQKEGKQWLLRIVLPPRTSDES
jgi:hypothetical protein